jgi:AraC-like DNA-binding protein
LGLSENDAGIVSRTAATDRAQIDALLTFVGSTMPDLTPFPTDRSPQVLVENRTSVGGRDLQFSVYDTYQPAQSVSLHARNLLYCGMVTGRKTIYTGEAEAPFDFLPGESLVVPAGRSIQIDFPDAESEAPTTCITLEIEQGKVQRIVDRLNETMPRSAASGDWVVQDRFVHFSNTSAIENVLQTLVTLFSENHAYRDALIDLNAAELVVRILQTEARSLLLAGSEDRSPSHGLAAAVQYVHDHLDRHVSVEELAAVACMSRSTFYRNFRNEFGITPLQYVNQRRMERAQSLLEDQERTVTDVSYDLGYSSVSHFITKFREIVGVTPKTFQERQVPAE